MKPVRSFSVFEAEEAAAPRVGLVASHHAGPLLIAHGGGTTVSEQIDIDILCPDAEKIVASLRHDPAAFLRRGRTDGFDHLDAERLDRWTARHRASFSLIQSCSTRAILSPFQVAVKQMAPPVDRPGPGWYNQSRKGHIAERERR